MLIMVKTISSIIFFVSNPMPDTMCAGRLHIFGLVDDVVVASTFVDVERVCNVGGGES